MVCIYCSGPTQVTNSRLQKRSNQVWRRRQCRECQAVFTTIESVDTSQALSVQSANGLTPFSREILLLSVYDSLRHRKTAVSDATALTGTIIGKLRPHIQDGAITRNQIVKTTAEVLDRFDKAAAVSYRAFHP